MWKVTCDRCHEVILDRPISNTKDLPAFFKLEIRSNTSMGNNIVEADLCGTCYTAIRKTLNELEIR